MPGGDDRGREVSVARASLSIATLVPTPTGRSDQRRLPDIHFPRKLGIQETIRTTAASYLTRLACQACSIRSCSCPINVVAAEIVRQLLILGVTFFGSGSPFVILIALPLIQSAPALNNALVCPGTIRRRVQWPVCTAQRVGGLVSHHFRDFACRREEGWPSGTRNVQRLRIGTSQENCLPPFTPFTGLRGYAHRGPTPRAPPSSGCAL